MNKKNEKGFTLIEIIVVIGIIGILAAILIPTFSGMVKNSENKVCKANISVIDRSIAAHTALGDEITEQTVGALLVQEFHAAAEDGKYLNLCPKGGYYTVTVENRTAHITCSIHGKTNLQIVNENIEKLTANSTLMNYLKSGKLYVDSTGPNYGAVAKTELKNALKLSGEDFDFRIYRNEKTQKLIVYTFDQVKDIKTGTVISATQYNLDYQTGAIVSTVNGTAKVTETTTTDSKTKKDVTHKVLDASTFKPNN